MAMEPRYIGTAVGREGEGLCERDAVKRAPAVIHHPVNPEAKLCFKIRIFLSFLSLSAPACCHQPSAAPLWLRSSRRSWDLLMCPPVMCVRKA